MDDPLIRTIRGFGAQGGAVAHGWRIPNISRVLVYKLGGTHTLPPAPVDLREMPEPAGPVTASSEVVEQGFALYQRQCAWCHGDGLRTGGLNPDLRWSSSEIHGLWQDIVRGGMLQSPGMVSFEQFLSEDDAEAIRQYVLSEAHRIYRSAHADWNPEPE